MNDLENEASSKAVDSLINYETVKVQRTRWLCVEHGHADSLRRAFGCTQYFGNESYEADQYDKSMRVSWLGRHTHPHTQALEL